MTILKKIRTGLIREGSIVSIFSFHFVQEPSHNWENPTKKELWGNIEGGHPWNYQPNGAITHIKIRWGSNIDAISFKSTDGKGNWTQFGGSTGREEPPVCILFTLIFGLCFNRLSLFFSF